MCYSALVEQSAKKLAKGFKARIDENAFLDLFTQRSQIAEQLLNGDTAAKKVIIPKNMEWEFVRNPIDASGKAIEKQILRWWKLEEKRLHAELQKQKERVKKAEASLHKRETKKAHDDIRIGTTKIKRANEELEYLRQEPSGESDSWIWPKYYFPGIIHEKERVIRPFRYLIRPRGQSPDFDEKYNGAYNAQQERLDEVFFWRELFGRNHGYFKVYRFKERQDEDLISPAKKLKIAAPSKTRKEYEFNPGAPMVVPFIWDHWKDKTGELPDIYGAAAITCDPPKEVLKLGIGRLLTPLKEENLSKWERPDGKSEIQLKKILADYEWNSLDCSEVA